MYYEGALINADIDIHEHENKTEAFNSNESSVEIKDSRESKEDWTDTFFGSETNLFPSSSTKIMTEVVNSDKSPEEQLEEIKEMATSITNAIQSEMANLLSYALSITDNSNEDNKERKKRSVDSPMDSTKLVWRLLKHIKSNNEYQNIAIEKMMSAQEIADKYGIEFTPDTEILSELAVAANEQAKELTSILKDACDLKNSTDSFTDETKEDCVQVEKLKNVTCSIHPLSHSEYDVSTNGSDPQIDNHTHVELNHVHYADPYASYNHYHSLPYETQIPSPPVLDRYSSPSVSPKQSFYDAVSYNPVDYYGPYCSMEPMTNTYIIPLDDFMEPEPDLVGEEFEETISSKIYVDHDVDPGMATVNHVMTYTIAEKAHYRTPQIENLPQQMQYYFLLV
ncbi:uncharacterized protein [Battus philenor]|uniref:uncharacterized protein n=1 Tax=Battus philenor TaxID=42288 RepID=UPI0035CE8944